MNKVIRRRATGVLVVGNVKFLRSIFSFKANVNSGFSGVKHKYEEWTGTVNNNVTPPGSHLLFLNISTRTLS